MTEPEFSTLAARVAADFGEDPGRWFEPGVYESVALAVLNSIYSTGHHFTGVLNALDRYRAARIADGFDPDRDSAADLVAAVDRWGGVPGLVQRTNNWATSSKNGAPRKADAALGAARILSSEGLNTVEEVRAALSDPEAQETSPAKKQWLRLPGQRSGLTWTYFLMLCGVPGVKADRMVVRYISTALGHHIDPKEAAWLVGQLADHLDVTRNKLDHTIWRLESGRAYLIEPE